MKKEALRELPTEIQYAEVKKILIQELVQLGIITEQEDPAEDSLFLDHLGMDSLDFIEFVIHLEKATGIYVPDEAINHREDTIGSLIQSFVKHINK